MKQAAPILLRPRCCRFVVTAAVFPVGWSLHEFCLSLDVIQLTFHRGSRFLMELARFPAASQFRRGQTAELFPREFARFLAAIPSRCGHLVELSPRVCLLCLSFLLLVTCPRVYLE